MKLYKVEYRTWNCFMSDLIDREMLSIGNNKNEAISLVMKNVDKDARDFKATEINNVFGHNILVED